MANGSKKQKNELRKQIGKKFFGQLHAKDITELQRISRVPANELIPSSVTQSPSLEDLGPKKFKLRFDFMNWNECSFQKADSSRMKSLLEKFCIITDTRTNDLPSAGLVHGKVTRDGEYASLFNSLDASVNNLLEGELAGYSRFYFFTVVDNFQIVAVDTVHRNK